MKWDISSEFRRVGEFAFGFKLRNAFWLERCFGSLATLICLGATFSQINLQPP